MDSEYYESEIDLARQARRRKALWLLGGYVFFIGGFGIWVALMEFLYRSSAGGR